MTMQQGTSRARRTHAREDNPGNEQHHEWDFSPRPDETVEGVPLDDLLKFHLMWKECQEAIDQANEKKRLLMGLIRKDHGNGIAESTRLALNLMLKEPGKRGEHFLTNEKARLMVTALERETEGESTINAH